MKSNANWCSKSRRQLYKNENFNVVRHKNQHGEWLSIILTDRFDNHLEVIISDNSVTVLGNKEKPISNETITDNHRGYNLFAVKDTGD